jgi:hypothetical protein
MIASAYKLYIRVCISRPLQHQSRYSNG